MIAASMYSPKFVNEALRVLGKQLIDDGRLDSVSLYSAGPTADFPELDTREWQEDDYDQQGNLLDPIKVKEGKRGEIEWVLKQKLFDYVPQSECAERQGRPYSLKWVLKNKGEKVRARLVVREIKKAKSEYEKLEPSDVFSAMPPVESLKALVSHVMTERVDKRGRILVLAVLTYRERTFTECVNAMFTLNHLLSYTVLVLWRSSTRRCTERKMRAMRGRSCGVNIFATMALSLVQAILHCTDQSL